MVQDLTKRLYVRNVDEWETILSDGKLSNRKLGVKVVDHGIILPARKHSTVAGYAGGVCDENFNFVAGFNRFNTGRKAWINVDAAYSVAREDIVQLDEDVIFGGTLNGHFGHFMMENWCRLWYVLQHPELDFKIVFIIAKYGQKSWFDDFFRLMGIAKERIVYVNKPTQFRSVTVPDQSQYWNDFTKEWTLPFQAIKSHVKPAEPKKLYLTRTKLEGKTVHIHNEGYFEDFFSAHGFEVVAPEKLTSEEQISLIMGADEIAATMGTLTHWALFCKPTAKFIMLPRTENYDGHFQRIVNNIFSNYYIVDVSKNFMYANHDTGECLIGSTKYWKEFVSDYFGEQIDEDDDAPYFDDALENYVNFWFKKYANTDKVVSSLRDMCNRIVTLENKLHIKRPLLTYQTHVDKFGWGTWKFENQISNPLEQRRDIQAIKIDFPEHKVYYSVYFNDAEGWSQEVSSSEMAGTVGKAKPITGIKIRLDDSGGGAFDILYRVHTFDGVWTPWARNGAELLSQGVKLNSIQIKLETKT